MTTPHKHAEYIIAFAQGKRVECRHLGDHEFVPVLYANVFDEPKFVFRIAPSTMMLGKREVPVPKLSYSGALYALVGPHCCDNALYFDGPNDALTFWSALVELVRENTR